MLRNMMAACLVLGISSPVLAADVTYRKDIAPLFKAKCGYCHGAESPYLGDFNENKAKFEADSLGPRMDSYADLIFYVGWPDTGALMRRLDDGKNAGGKAGNMYKRLGSSEEERQKNLALFKEWVGPDAWNLNRWKAKGDVPAITKEQVDKIKVKY
ncbi:MAG: cytochrome C [Burkholderiaceae bacterium]|nr:cytochrome C [Burkholderiaceae bacterium]